MLLYYFTDIMKKTRLVAGIAAIGALIGSIASANTTQIEFCVNIVYLPSGTTVAGVAGLAQNGTALNSVPLQRAVGNTFCATVPQVAGANQVYIKPYLPNTNLTQVNTMGSMFPFANVPQMSHMNIQSYYLTTNTTYDIVPFARTATYEDGQRIGFDGPGTPVKDPEDPTGGHDDPNPSGTGDATGSGDLRCRLQITPSTSGPAPHTVNVMGYTNRGQFVVLYRGDGGFINNPTFGLSHTYTTAGNYQISAGVAGNNNTAFAKCLANINVQGGATGTGTTNPGNPTTT